ncbi:MAG: hypothetical protein Q7R40_13120 [Phaeospirillum sp.]|nr:hypothetical protein [Phaeospirillum sp.]
MPRRIATGLAVLGSLLAIAFFTARLGSAISFGQPLQAGTSGWEQENMFAVWLWLHGKPVYTRLTDIPFAMAVYNWLFYAFYGTGAGWLLGALHLNDAWIPTVSRLLTLAALPLAGLGAFRCFRHPSSESGPPPAMAAAAAALYVACGPLIGFWGMTIRPDSNAMMLEILAVAAFLGRTPARPWGGLLAAVVLAYLAWSFKHTAINAAGAIFLLLLSRRRFAEAAGFAVALGGLAALTLTLGTEAYLRNILLLDYKRSLDLGRTVAVLANAASKTAPAMAGMAVLAGLALLRPAIRQVIAGNERLLLGVTGAVISTALALATSTHSGAAENYYFTAHFFMLLAVLAAWPHRLLTPVVTAFAAGWTVQAALLAYALGGGAVISLAAVEQRIATAAACLKGLPQPLYVEDLSLALPWMSGGSVPYGSSYAYIGARLAGTPMQEDGIGGMIRSGRFGSLALNSEDTHQFDGGSLLGYERVSPPCGGMTIYLRKGTAAPSDPR